MQLDDQTANAVITRPTAAAPGAQRWFRARDLGGGITGTTMEEDYLNDHLGSVIAVLAAGGVTRTKGAAGDSDMLNAILALQARMNPGQLQGRLKRTAAGIIQLQPLNGTYVSAVIDDVPLRTSGAISWNMASDLEGSETASLKLYLYLKNDAGALDPLISAVVPDLPGDTKPGYKSDDVLYRCVGSTYNNLAQDFIECTWGPGGQVLIHSHDADHEHDIGGTANGWTSQALNLPWCASSVILAVHTAATDRAMAIAASDATTDPTVKHELIGTNASEILLTLGESSVSVEELDVEGVIPIADPTAPAFLYTTYNEVFQTLDVAVKGYTCLFAPR